MLITIEGIDGTGKSTLAKMLYSQLKNDGHHVLLTKEPGGSALGKKLREILQSQPVPITPVAEFLLFAADRAQHFQDVVIPALEKNEIVISDRMADSSIVYQGFGRGIDIEMIKKVNAWVMQGIKPDLTLYVTVPLAVAMERLQTRKKLTAFEKKQEERAQKLLSGFENLYKNRDDVITIDGAQSPDQVAQNSYKAIASWL